jgi:hypothetical protein
MKRLDSQIIKQKTGRVNTPLPSQWNVQTPLVREPSQRITNDLIRKKSCQQFLDQQNDSASIGSQYQSFQSQKTF